MKTFLIALVLMFVTGVTVRADDFENVRKRADKLSNELDNVSMPQKSPAKIKGEEYEDIPRDTNKPDRNFVWRKGCTKYTSKDGNIRESCTESKSEWEIPFPKKQ